MRSPRWPRATWSGRPRPRRSGACSGRCSTTSPGLPDAELGDGTPAANAETRAWLKDEILPEPPPAPSASFTVDEPRFEVESATTVSDAPDVAPDAWDEALELAREGRTSEGVQRLRRAVNAAATGRERFLRKLQLAELCLMAQHHRVALPLAEDLARQVDEFHLEEWEDEQLCARVWAALYRCLRHAVGEAGASERLQQVFTRLCRLDINQAMQYGDDRSGS